MVNRSSLSSERALQSPKRTTSSSNQPLLLNRLRKTACHWNPGDENTASCSPSVGPRAAGRGVRADFYAARKRARGIVRVNDVNWYARCFWCSAVDQSRTVASADSVKCGMWGAGCGMRDCGTRDAGCVRWPSDGCGLEATTDSNLRNPHPAPRTPHFTAPVPTRRDCGNCPRVPGARSGARRPRERGSRSPTRAR
jgi:hypothetical protein